MYVSMHVSTTLKFQSVSVYDNQFRSLYLKVILIASSAAHDKNFILLLSTGRDENVGHCHPGPGSA